MKYFPQKDVQKLALKIMQSRKILQIQLPVHGWINEHDIKSNVFAAKEVVASFREHPEEVKLVIFRRGKL